MDNLVINIQHKYELLKNALITGDFTQIINETKRHILLNKNVYIVLTFLVIFYILYENDLNIIVSRLVYRLNNYKQNGGDDTEPITKENVANTKPEQTAKASNANSMNNLNSTGSKVSQITRGASGLCDGENIIAKLCRGTKDGIGNYFKLFGYIILAGLAILSPFVIYIILVYMVLKIMFTGFKKI